MQRMPHIKLVTESFPDGELQISRLAGKEAISQLFEYELLVAGKGLDGFDPAALMGERAALIYERDGEEVGRRFGMIAAVHDLLDSETEHQELRLTFVPRAYRLTLTETLDVFLDTSVPDIVRRKLEGLGLKERSSENDREARRGGADEGEPEYDFELRLRERYPVREFVVQYKETDLAFISRLCEHIGISFFFEHDRGRDVMVFTDVNEGFRPAGADPRVPFRARGDQRDVYRIEEAIRMVPADYVVRDYNYRTPQVALTGQASLTSGSGSVVEYGAHVKTPEEATYVARIRAEERLASHRVLSGTSDLPALRAGLLFTLDGHPRGDLGLLLTEVRQTAQQVTLGTGVGDTSSFRSEFKAIRSEIRYRPPRLTPKPRIHGVVTGVIDAASKGEYAEVDDQGRYKVKFLFDTAKRDEAQASRPVRMAQPHAGAGYGMHFPLRPGVEVILTFVDGDPDRPIIAATVPNPQTASPVTSGNAPRNIIRTGGGNEINIDDTKDGHRIKLSTPHKNTVFQLGHRNAPEDGAMLETLGSSTTAATTSISNITALNTVLSSIKDYKNAGSITTVAEAAKWWQAALSIGRDVVNGLLGAASFIVDCIETDMKRREEESHKKSIEAQKTAWNKMKARDAKRKALADLLAGDSTANPPTQDLFTQMGISGQALTDARSTYQASVAQYQSDVDLHRTNMEWLTSAKEGEWIPREGVAQAEYTFDSAAQVRYLTDQVAQSQATLDGNGPRLADGSFDLSKRPTATVDPGLSFATTAERDAWLADKQRELDLKFFGSKEMQKRDAAALDAQIRQALKAKLGHPSWTDAELATYCKNNPSNPACAAYTSYESKKKDVWGDGTTANPGAEAESDTAWNAADTAKNDYNTLKGVNEMGDMAMDLKKAKVALDMMSGGMTLVSEIVALIVTLKEIKERLDELEEMTETLTAVSSALPRTDAQIKPFSRDPIKASLLRNKFPVRHTVGATDGDMHVFGEKNLYMWGDHATLRGQTQLVAVGKRASFLAEEKAEIAAKDQLFLTSKAGPVDVEAKSVRVFAEDGNVLVASQKKKIEVLAQEDVRIESFDKRLDARAKAAVRIESTDDEIGLRAKSHMSLESTDGTLGLKSKNDLAIESTDGDLKLKATKKAALLWSEKDMTVMSNGARTTVWADKNVDIGSESANVTIGAKKIALNGVVEVGDALLVKGEPVATKPSVDLAFQWSQRTWE